MKRFVLTVVNSCLYALSTIFLAWCVMMYYFGGGSMLVASLVPFLLSLVTYLIASRTGSYIDKESCKKEFSDVSGIKRRGIIILGVVTAVLFFTSLTCHYIGLTKYDSLYPNSVDVLIEEYEGNDMSVAICKSLPSWLAQRVLSDCQAIYDIKQAEYSTEETQSIMDDLSDLESELNFQMVISFILSLAFGVAFTYSKRCQQYHTAMKFFNKNGGKK